jgi:spectinomycin phosphotransferase
VREPPPDVDDADVLAVVRDRWLPGADAVEHLPVGFGAWHWRASYAGEPRLFVTLDVLGVHHTADTLEATYAAAAALADDLDLVVASLPGPDGRFTAPLGAGAVSATPWIEGERPDGSATAWLLDRLHAAAPPSSLPRWHPLVGPDLPERLAARTLGPWTAGPHGEEARHLLLTHLDDVAGWTADYLDLAASTDPATWVTTHGEPHVRNQLETARGVVLVDWESARLAPAERDLRWLTPATGDPDLLHMFALEWRLDEIAQYADWFEQPHTGTESDRVALGGLRSSLEE